jgi:membrane protein DedA with SNARE-associated domain
MNSTGFVLTGDLSWTILYRLIGKMHPSTATMPGQAPTALQIFPVPVLLLVMGIFYLWIYARRSWAGAQPPAPVES